ncbi:hypothetical protein AGMMS4957_02880 [Bacteroidia bacterium]|nr:hypothetical protein AGMMS4957_02880 [Bacteroidia bacterium]
MQSNYVLHAREKYDSYDPSCWTKAYFDDVSGGFNVYHTEHKFSQTEGGGDAEKIVGKMLAKHNGKQVEFLPEGKDKSPDCRFEGQTWDVKFINHANEETIRGCIKDARKANNVIFYWNLETNKLEELKNAVTRSIGYFKSKNILEKMPHVYYINHIGLLKQIY